MRAHERARGGAGAEPSAREVTVHALTLEVAAGDTLIMHCTTSSGTYIRSLARDIAEALGTCGHLTVLRRLSIGPWSVAENAGAVEWGRILHSYWDFEMLDFFPLARITHLEEHMFVHGNPFSPKSKPEVTGLLRIAAPEHFLGIGHYDGEKITVAKVYPTVPGATYPRWDQGYLPIPK